MDKYGSMILKDLRFKFWVKYEARKVEYSDKNSLTAYNHDGEYVEITRKDPDLLYFESYGVAENLYKSSQAEAEEYMADHEKEGEFR